jgi:hypothetical protein
LFLVNRRPERALARSSAPSTEAASPSAATAKPSSRPRPLDGGAPHGAAGGCARSGAVHRGRELYGALDLGEVCARGARPDNLYWEQGVPTKDPEVLEKREQEKNPHATKSTAGVLAGDANEDEVNAYYDYRQRLSSDYHSSSPTTFAAISAKSSMSDSKACSTSQSG